MIHRRSQDIVKQLSLGFSFPKSFPQGDIQSYTEKTTQSVFCTWAIMLMLISCSFLPLCLRLFFLDPLSVDPACCCAILIILFPLPVLGNDWVKIRLIRLFLTITHTHPQQPSALSSLTHSRRPLRSGVFQDLPTWALTWSVLLGLLKQQLQCELMLSCIIMPVSTFPYRQECTTQWTRIPRKWSQRNSTVRILMGCFS